MSIIISPITRDNQFSPPAHFPHPHGTAQEIRLTGASLQKNL